MIFEEFTRKKKNLFEEYHLGHWVISQSLFEGLPNVVSKLRKLLG